MDGDIDKTSAKPVFKFGAASRSGSDVDTLLDDIVREAQEQVGVIPDLGFVFATPELDAALSEIVAEVVSRTGVRIFLGCNGDGIIGPQHEHEAAPALSVWLASLPGVQMEPLRLERSQVEDEALLTSRLNDSELRPGSTILTVADPFSTDISRFFRATAQVEPSCVISGGMASGGRGPGQTLLVYGDEILEDGMVGVIINGGATIDTVVSQGCRPIGKPFIVTRSEKNSIQEIAGQPPLKYLQELFGTLSPKDQVLLQNGLFVGRAINEYQESFDRGDFLVRNVVGADHDTGAIAIMDRIDAGITVQFHVRDAQTADEDLRLMLSPHREDPPEGALVFSCNGRGRNLFNEPDHDVGVLREICGGVPAAGFFCAGEFGPVQDQNFVHGYTASIALFRSTHQIEEQTEEQP